MLNDPARTPAVILACDPPGPLYLISSQCAMPKITATATLQNLALPASVPVQFRWQVSLAFEGNACVHAKGRVIRHAAIDVVTTEPCFVIPFTQVRGGSLTVSLTAMIAGVVQLTAESSGLAVGGTNPSVEELRAAVADAGDGFKRLMRLESGLCQFRSPLCPLFSADNLGGVGLCQITSPAPTDDQVWSWQENLKAGLALYRSKQAVARAYPAKVRASAAFKALVAAYNERRAQQKLPPLMIVLPEYTPEQLERDTLRGFNGYAGQLHEYRVQVDADGVLVVVVDPAGAKSTAMWERVTAAMRTACYDKAKLAANRRGDPDYVNDVEAQATF